MKRVTEALSVREFERIAALAYEACGVDLMNGKRKLIEARLRKKIGEGKFASFEEYHQRILADGSGAELAGLLDALTTNVTAFLREPAHFDFLRKTIGRWRDWRRVKPDVRRMVEFRRLNLMKDFEAPLRFHAIFCRNVMIYFDTATRANLVNRFAACLEPGGYLLVGHSESLAGIAHPYQYVGPAVYRKPR